MKKNVLGFIANGNFHHFKALRGERGEKGDTVIVGDEGVMTLYNELGHHTDGPVTQDAVTNAIMGLDVATDKGMYPTYESLVSNWPSPKVGWKALVGTSAPLKVYGCRNSGEWYDTGITVDFDSVDLSNVLFVGDLVDEV